MNSLSLHEFHASLVATFIEVNGHEVVDHYGDVAAEHAALTGSIGVLDLSFRSRLCLTGADRQRFLHGQVTNDVNKLQPGQGCYAALISAKGRMQSDLNIYRLDDELLLDFEPGLGAIVAERLEKYIIADDVQIVDVTPHYGLLSVQGPQAGAAVEKLQPGFVLPILPFNFSKATNAMPGEIYLMNQPRLSTTGFDLFVPTNALAAVADKLMAAAKELGGRACGWSAMETARIEAGLPRFGADMDESNLPPEAGLDARAISYNKGCYIGQEVIARIRTYGQVAKALRGLRLANDITSLPVKGDKLFHGDKDAGFITSAVHSPRLKACIALGYVRREASGIGTELLLRNAAKESTATIVELPFVK